MRLNKSQKIIIIIGLSAFILLSNYTPPEEAIAVLDTTFIIEKELVGTRISGAQIDCYQHNVLGGVGSSPSFTIYSSVDGIAHRIIAQGVYTVIVTAVNYNVYTNDNLDLRVSNEVNPARTFTIPMIPGTGGNPPAGTVPITFTLVDPSNDRVSAYITVDGSTYLSDGHGFSRIYLSLGTHSIQFHGYYQKDTSLGGVKTDFDFTKTITVTTATQYTVYVATGAVMNEPPPDEKDNSSEETPLQRFINFIKDLVSQISGGGGSGGNWWDWLWGSIIPGVPNYVILLVVFALFLLGRR